MTSWYYVQGTERMGPVEEKELHNIFIAGTIVPESYVWTKGFANWEKLQDVTELKYFLLHEITSCQVLVYRPQLLLHRKIFALMSRETQRTPMIDTSIQFR